MTGYKAFQDWYTEAKIKHLILEEYQEQLVSPPFATEKCKDYSDIFFWDGKRLNSTTLDLPPVTSKTNCTLVVNNKLYLIPYGIWDGFQTVVEIDGTKPNYHQLNSGGKGQFYSGATSGYSGFSFPLGYEETNYCIHIEPSGNVRTREFYYPNFTKLHMGTIWCNGKFWSMPRCDEPGYSSIVNFDGTSFNYTNLNGINSNVRRKYSDCISVGDKIYSLPFGEDLGLTEVVELDTNTNEYNLYPINGNDFSKKYNTFTLVDNTIIGLPYGDEHCEDSNWGVVFNIETKESWQFDIGIYHGGKYRYRSGLAYKGSAFFFPSGTPSCPIFKIDTRGNIIERKYFNQVMLGRPIVWNDWIYCMAYDIQRESHHLLKFDERLNYWEEFCI